MRAETKELKWIDRRLNLFTVVSINSFMFHRKSVNLIKTLKLYSVVFCTTGHVAWWWQTLNREILLYKCGVHIKRVNLCVMHCSCLSLIQEKESEKQGDMLSKHWDLQKLWLALCHMWDTCLLCVCVCVCVSACVVVFFACNNNCAL